MLPGKLFGGELAEPLFFDLANFFRDLGVGVGQIAIHQDILDVAIHKYRMQGKRMHQGEIGREMPGHVLHIRNHGHERRGGIHRKQNSFKGQHSTLYCAFSRPIVEATRERACWTSRSVTWVKSSYQVPTE